MTAIAIVGPTAAGKSSVALEVAERCRGEIVSVDSMQVYRGMDIGTAKATVAMQKRVRHHLVDIVGPELEFSVAEFQRAGHEVLSDLEGRGIPPIICGGSGLHFRALVDPLHFPPNDEELRAEIETIPPSEARSKLASIDPTAGQHIDLANPRRVSRALEIHELTGLTPSQRADSPEAEAVRTYEPERSFVAVGLDPGDELRGRVEQRLDQMIESGLLEEVERLWPHMGRLAAQAVGYKELVPVIDGSVNLADGRASAIQATMALAKRQRTFFRRDPRIVWAPWHPDPALRSRRVLAYLDKVVSWSS